MFFLMSFLVVTQGLVRFCLAPLLADAFGFKDAYDFDKTFIEEETSSQEDGRTDSGSIDDDENYPHEGLPLLSDYSEDKRNGDELDIFLEVPVSFLTFPVEK